jgi:hypothetical protein
MKKLFTLFILLSLIFSCKNKDKIKSENNISEISINSNILLEDNNVSVDQFRIRYINSPEGLNVRDQPDINSMKITTLPNMTSVFVLEINGELNIIDGLENYWYFVQSKSVKGWVFGAYLVNDIMQINNLTKSSEIGNHIEFIANIYFEKAMDNKYIYNKMDILKRHGDISNYLGMNNSDFFELPSLNDNKFILNNGSKISTYDDIIFKIDNNINSQKIYSYYGENIGHAYVEIYYEMDKIRVWMSVFRPDITDFESLP